MLLNEGISKALVKGIELGLSNAKIAKRENTDRFDNSEAQRKIDKVMTYLCYELESEGTFETYMFKRGNYRLLLGYDRNSNVLISFMSQNRLDELINSNKIADKRNYIFGLMQLNVNDRQQQCLFELPEEIYDENIKVMNKVKDLINETDNIKYITVVYNINKYKLVNVKLVMLSRYAEVIEEMDISDYMTVNYEEIFEIESVEKEEILSDLEFNFKAEVLNNSNEVDIGLDCEKEQKDGE